MHKLKHHIIPKCLSNLTSQHATPTAHMQNEKWNTRSATTKRQQFSEYVQLHQCSTIVYVCSSVVCVSCLSLTNNIQVESLFSPCISRTSYFECGFVFEFWLEVSFDLNWSCNLWVRLSTALGLSRTHLANNIRFIVIDASQNCSFFHWILIRV